MREAWSDYERVAEVVRRVLVTPCAGRSQSEIDSLIDALAALLAGARAAERERWRAVREVIDAHCRDESLWFIARTAAEAYLQQELRALHVALESAVTAASSSPAIR